MSNLEYFEEVISWIKDPNLKAFAEQYVELFPAYFEVKPASSTGKYHAPWSNLRGGLRDHTKAVCYMIHVLSDAYMLNELEHDAAIVAGLGHDAVKYGFNDGRYTSKTHEAEGALFFKRVVKKLGAEGLPLFEEIYNAIAIHQGRWCVSDTPKRFPDDFDRIAQLVHIADMAAGRPEIRFNFLEASSLVG